VSARHLLLALSPLLLASASLLAREAGRPPAAAAPVPGVAREVPGPPALLLALPIAGRWRVLPEESRLRLVEHADGECLACEAVDLEGEILLEPDGRLADLDLEAQLDPGATRALLGPVGEGRLALRSAAARSLPSAVPGARSARPQAWISLDGRRRQQSLRAAWMACDATRLRLQLEACWAGDARGNQDALRGLLSGSRRCTLALDLVLTRS
jgi:hypothetical protein